MSEKLGSLMVSIYETKFMKKRNPNLSTCELCGDQFPYEKMTCIEMEVPEGELVEVWGCMECAKEHNPDLFY